MIHDYYLYLVFQSILDIENPLFDKSKTKIVFSICMDGCAIFGTLRNWTIQYS